MHGRSAAAKGAELIAGLGAIVLGAGSAWAIVSPAVARIAAARPIRKQSTRMIPNPRLPPVDGP